MSKRKISLLLTVVWRAGRGGRGRAFQREERPCSSTQETAQDGTGFRPCTSALAYGTDWIEKRFFFSIRERLPQTSCVCSCACFSFFLTSLWVNAARLKRRAGKYKGGWIQTSDLQKGHSISNSTASPLSQPWGTEKEGLKQPCQFWSHHAPFSSIWTIKYNISV